MFRKFNDWLFDMDAMGMGCFFKFMGLIFILSCILCFIFGLLYKK
jgi:hypothetical protein